MAGLAGLWAKGKEVQEEGMGARLYVCAPLGLALACGALTVPAARSAAQERGGKMLVYIGTYTGAKSKGIYAFHLDMATGKLTPAASPAAEVRSPSFLAIHPNGRFLYAVNEIADFEGKPAGGVTAFAIDRNTGGLRQLNQQSSRGSGPCHISVDRDGKNVLIANYGGGSVAVLPIQADGSLAPASAFVQHQGSSANPQRQEGPHAHSINLDRANRYAFAADLGLDKILVYRYDAAKGTLTPNEPASVSVAPGAGPRHFAFHPSGRYAYVINEMGNTVTAFNYDPERGILKQTQSMSTLPALAAGPSYTAEVQCHPTRPFLYGSNRGHDSIAIIRVESTTGRLIPVGHQLTGGKTPRNFGIDPTGTFLIAANQGSDNLVVFRIDPETGTLKQVGEPVSVGSPVCVKFLPVR
jgi:6-phosphogluconolactonase